MDISPRGDEDELWDINLSCKPFIKSLALKHTDMVRCAIENNSPSQVCTKCVEQYIHFREQQYRSLHLVNTTSLDNRTCTAVIYNCLQINWDFEHGNSSHTFDKKTVQFKEYLKKLRHCVVRLNESSPGQICQSCQKDYETLFGFYWKIFSDPNTFFCIDVDSEMNDTMKLWQVLIFSVSVLAIVIVLFYAGSYIQSEQTNSNLIHYSRMQEAQPVGSRSRILSSSTLDSSYQHPPQKQMTGEDGQDGGIRQQHGISAAQQPGVPSNTGAHLLKNSLATPLASLPAAPPQCGPPTVSLALLIDFAIHWNYRQFEILSELNSKKKETDRKISVVEFAHNTRLIFVRLLAIVRWLKSAKKFEPLASIRHLLDEQATRYVESADRLVEIARNELPNARLPAFQVAQAVDVLTLGSYPRLPQNIKERFIPPASLSAAERRLTLRRLNQLIEFHLAQQAAQLSPRIRQIAVRNGMAILMVPGEFEMALTRLGDDPATRWMLLNIRILVESAEAYKRRTAKLDDSVQILDDNDVQMVEESDRKGVDKTENGAAVPAASEGVRAPIAPVQGVLIDQSFRETYQNRNRTWNSVFEQHRHDAQPSSFFSRASHRAAAISGPNMRPDLGEEVIVRPSGRAPPLPMVVQPNQNDESRPANSQHRKVLQSIFRPPVELMFQGDWDQALQAARQKGVWLLVNVQEASEFACAVLNRDIWSAETVREVYHDSADGARIRGYYGLTSFPAIFIVDPRTGEEVSGRLKASEPVSFLDSWVSGRARVVQLLLRLPDGRGERVRMWMAAPLSALFSLLLSMGVAPIDHQLVLDYPRREYSLTQQNRRLSLDSAGFGVQEVVHVDRIKP
uniref:Mediator of RNA polymerase II transcription subunit 14 n=1 Tax=Globodera pallida TaxID=36090 RepID=A0A183CH68_GLOPA